MLGTGTEAPKRGQMLRRWVSLVLGEAVLGMPSVEASHPGVARGFGQDRGSGDRGDGGVALDDHPGWEGKSEVITPVGEHDLRRSRQLRKRAPSGKSERGAQSEPVKFARLNPSDRGCRCAIPNQGRQAAVFPMPELLAVTQIGQPARSSITGEYDSCSHERSGKRPPTHLIDTDYDFQTGAPVTKFMAAVGSAAKRWS